MLPTSLKYETPAVLYQTAFLATTKSHLALSTKAPKNEHYLESDKYWLSYISREKRRSPKSFALSLPFFADNAYLLKNQSREDIYFENAICIENGFFTLIPLSLMYK